LTRCEYGASVMERSCGSLASKSGHEGNFLRITGRFRLGEQEQVDWVHFGHLEIGRARRPLMAFVMVLSYSRQIFLRFYFDARIENFLRGHVAAFTAWGGVPRASALGAATYSVTLTSTP